VFQSTNSGVNQSKYSPFLSIINSRNVAWGLIVFFFVTSFGLPWLGLARLINFYFPVGSLLIGVYLYFRFPILYLGFTWWIWLISPFLRRIVDFRSSFTDPSPVLTAPFLVTLVTFLTVLKFLPRALKTGDGLPYALSLASILLTLCLGLINHAVPKVIEQFLNLSLIHISEPTRPY